MQFYEDPVNRHLSLAAKNGHISIIKTLLGYKNLILNSSHTEVHARKGALALASTGGFSEIVSLLLKSDFEYFVKDAKDINRALKAAIGSGKMSTVEVLLRWALENNIMTKLPHKIKKASENDIGEIIEFLTEQGREVNERRATRWNILQAKAHNGDVVAVLRLLDLGADIENDSSLLGTPLMAAASGGRLEVVKLLIERGANIMNIDIGKDRSGGSAVDYAAANGHEEVARHLLAKGAKFTFQSLYRKHHIGKREYNVLQLASWIKRSAPTLMLLLEHGADVNGVAGNPYIVDSPLSLAARSGDHASLQVLLDYGADVNAISVKTVLIEVMDCRGSQEVLPIVQTLIDKGANIDMVDKDGKTALMFAAAGIFPKLEAFRLLLENGADTSIRNAKQLTVLMIAAQYRKILIIEILLECKSD